eukprot:798699-Prymnesium_polylepis.1
MRGNARTAQRGRSATLPKGAALPLLSRSLSLAASLSLPRMRDSEGRRRESGGRQARAHAGGRPARARARRHARTRGSELLQQRRDVAARLGRVRLQHEPDAPVGGDQHRVARWAINHRGTLRLGGRRLHLGGRRLASCCLE